MNILVIEDSAEDVMLLERELNLASLDYVLKQVDSLDSLVVQLNTFAPDLVLADYTLPGFDGITALRMVQSVKPDVPFILLSGTIGEETAIEALKCGATDFVLKNNLKRLAGAVESAMRLSDATKIERMSEEKALQVLEMAHRSDDHNAISWQGLTLDVLVLEDTESDIELLEAQFRNETAKFRFKVVQTEDEFSYQLEKSSPSVILADFSLPSFDGLGALQIRNRLQPDTPFILVSGVMGEEVAIESMKLGASDYVLKDKLGRLVPVVLRAWERAEERKRRRQVEKSLSERQEITRSILETANDVILTLDASGTIMSANPAFEKVFAFDSEQAIGASFCAIVPNFDLASFNHNYGHFTPLHHKELMGQRRDGSQFAIDLSINKLNVAGRSLFTAIINDITERQQLQAELSKQIDNLEELNEKLKLARDQAIEANRLKSQFVANISHEIRTPMSGLLGMLELAMMDPQFARGEAAELVSTAFRSASDLMHVVNDLLDFSKLQAGFAEVVEGEFYIAGLLDEVVQSILPAAKKHGILITEHIDESLRNRAFIADGRIIKQVLLNLAHNGVKFTEKGSVDIAVTTGEQHGHQLQLKFVVTDTGIGIAPDDKDKLGKPFVQADGSTTRKHGGTGLGLSLCHGYVKLLGGEMGFESKLGAGSLFWFSVPARLGEI